MTNIGSQPFVGQFGQELTNSRATQLSVLTAPQSATGVGNAPVVAQIPIAVAGQDPNVIQVNRRLPDTVAVGRVIPGVGLNGAAADAAGYILWSGQHTLTPTDDKLTAFGSLPLPPRLASAAGFAPLVGFVLTQLGVAESASAADVLAGKLFSQYQQLDALLNSPAFKGALPAGATVIPSLVASTPIQGITSVLDNSKTEIGLGLTIVLPTGTGEKATKTAFFINSRQNLDQLLRGQNPDRSINFGGLLINAKIPKTGQAVNIGPAWRSTLSSSGSGPWELQFADGTAAALPTPLAMVANALFDRSAPYGNADFGELSRLIEQVPPDVREQAGAVINGGLYVADTVTSISSIAAAFKAVGLTGPHGLILGGAFVLGGQFLEQYDIFVQENARLAFQKGEFTPALALPAGQHRGAYYGNTNIDILKATVELAIANGASVDVLRTQWEDVLDGNINGGLSGTDLLQARFAAANLLGRGEEAVALYRQLEAELGPPGVGVLVGDPAFIASAARNYAIDALASRGQTEVVDSNRIFSEPRSLGWVGGTLGQDGIGRQGLLVTAKDRSGQDVFWLQGPADNYWLRDAGGALITNRDEAAARARELISNGAATRLYDLAPDFVSPDTGTVATPDNTVAVDGVAIVEPTVFVDYVGGEVGETGVGLQGKLQWAYTPTGERVFWLQGPSDNYLLRNPQGDLIRGQGEARQRARELIESGAATRLYDLPPQYVSGNGSVATTANTRTLDGVAIVEPPVFVEYVGGQVGNSGVGLQGVLNWAHSPSGGRVFWLQGPSDNYILRNSEGELIRGQGEARLRALDLIRSGSATQLYPLDISDGAIGNHGNRGINIDGVTVQGTPANVQYVGVESVGLQGLLMWGREPGGQVVFWLQGAEQTPGSGNRYNYVLRSPDGALIRSQGEALERARDYITHGVATRLEPL